MKTFKIPAIVFLAASFLLSDLSESQASNCTRLTAWFTAIDKNWVQPDALQAQDFQAELSGKPAKILSLSHDDQKRNLVILLDASGNGRSKATGDLPWNLVRNLASELANMPLGDTNIGLVVFNSKTVETLGFSAGRAAVAARLQQIAADTGYVAANVHGKSGLWDATQAALDILGPAKNGIIYAISYGRDDSSKVAESDLRRQLAARKVRFYATIITPSPENFRRLLPEERQVPPFIFDLSSNTGGAVFGPLTATPSGPLLDSPSNYPDWKLSVRALLANFYVAMFSGYRVELELPESPTNRSRWSLALEKSARQRYKGLTLAVARDIPSCPATP